MAGVLAIDVVEHQLGIAENGVERRAQLVAHIGEELRLVLARHRELPALVLDLVEQARVLDRQHRLRREGLQEIDRLLGELSRLLAAHHQRADMLGPEQRNDQQGAIAGSQDHLKSGDGGSSCRSAICTGARPPAAWPMPHRRGRCAAP